MIIIYLAAAIITSVWLVWLPASLALLRVLQTLTNL